MTDITLTREEAQQVLDALIEASAHLDNEAFVKVMMARDIMSKPLRARLSASEPEPVAWFSKLPDNKIAIKIVGKPTEGDWKPLYTDPPQREWQGLTDEDIKTLWDDHIIPVFNKNGISPFVFARAIEAKLQRNNDSN